MNEEDLIDLIFRLEEERGREFSVAEQRHLAQIARSCWEDAEDVLPLESVFLL